MEMGNAEASFNLGYMYFKGIGLARDFHLAKRYYDTSINLYPEGMIPVKIALYVLQWFQLYHHWIQILSQKELISHLNKSPFAKTVERLFHSISISVLMSIALFTWWLYRRMFR